MSHDWGWTRYREWFGETGPAHSLVPGRVTAQAHHLYEVQPVPAGDRLQSVRVSGAFEFRVGAASDFPAIGDFVLVDPSGGVIHEVMPRRTRVSRKSKGGSSSEQLIAANIDLIFLVFALDGERNFTVGLLERLLVIARAGEVEPVVILNKSDTVPAEEANRMVESARTHGAGAPVYAVSARTGAGLEAISKHLKADVTVSLFGKSGAGKSSLVNAIAGGAATDSVSTDRFPQLAREGEVREWRHQGRHTTSDSRLYQLASGLILADVPGIRELQLWGDQQSLDDAFEDIRSLAGECRFSDCTHGREPGCRIRLAIETGELTHERFARYEEYRRELAALERRRDEQARRAEERSWAKVTRKAAHARRKKRGE